MFMRAPIVTDWAKIVKHSTLLTIRIAIATEEAVENSKFPKQL